MEKKEQLPVIIYSKYINDSLKPLKDCVHEHQGKVIHELPFMSAISAEIRPDALYYIASCHVVKSIDEDAMVFKTRNPFFRSRPSLFKGAQTTKSQSLSTTETAQNLKYSGKGVGIAVIDTGVSPHVDLTFPNNRIAAFVDLIQNKKEPYDDDGHGTHVCGIIAGNRSANGNYKQLAPQAHIAAIKVLDHKGGGNASDILAGIQWALTNKERYNIKILNLSLGMPIDKPYQNDPLAHAASLAVKSGLTVITAAGNSGPHEQTINSPGTSPFVITVGSVSQKGSIAEFSSRGPTLSGEIKPDIVAPGVNILSLSHKNLYGYATLSGTSMSTPFISGGAALLYEKYPNATPEQIKKILCSCVVPLQKENAYAQGNGFFSLRTLYAYLEDSSMEGFPLYDRISI